MSVGWKNAPIRLWSGSIFSIYGWSSGQWVTPTSMDTRHCWAVDTCAEVALSTGYLDTCAKVALRFPGNFLLSATFCSFVPGGPEWQHLQFIVSVWVHILGLYWLSSCHCTFIADGLIWLVPVMGASDTYSILWLHLLLQKYKPKLVVFHMKMLK